MNIEKLLNSLALIHISEEGRNVPEHLKQEAEHTIRDHARILILTDEIEQFKKIVSEDEQYSATIGFDKMTDKCFKTTHCKITAETKTHILKIDPEQFCKVECGVKTFELRKNDRNFEVGDSLILRETLHSSHAMMIYGLPLEYTGKQLERTITHILSGSDYGLQKGWVILSLK